MLVHCCSVASWKEVEPGTMRFCFYCLASAGNPSTPSTQRPSPDKSGEEREIVRERDKKKKKDEIARHPHVPSDLTLK